MAQHSYKTRGTCSRIIRFDIEDGILRNVKFEGGCDGNLKAIGKLVEGANAQEIANVLRGNTCGPRSTSCGDQLAKAIDQAIAL